MEGDGSHIILYDGVCGLCNKSVQFVLARDPGGVFSYAALQSDAGRELLAKHGLPTTDLSSVVLVIGARAYTRSSAALMILKYLKTPLKIFYPLIILPRWFRDVFYNIVVRYRYRLFGKLDQCMIPAPEVRKRFL